MSRQLDYDVAIVGGSIGGCTAATLFARRGLKVALIEQRDDPHAYKKACTHFIQPSAVPTIEQLGLAAAIETAGGLRNVLEVWTPWGWIRDQEGPEHCGYNIRREKLDPLLRRLTTETTGVDFMPGYTARRLLEERGRIVGIESESKDGTTVIRARLVVAADGRQSHLAELAGVKAEVKPNNRFTYFTYYRDLPLGSAANSRAWYLGTNLAYAFVNDNGMTVLCVFLPLDRLDEWKRDVYGNFVRFWEQVPDGPQLQGAEWEGEMRGMIRMPNLSRPAAARGMAFIGDAALALDPIWGTGCGFAFQSAAWLVDCTAAALCSKPSVDHPLDQGLKQYRLRHRSETRGHAFHISDFSQVRQHRFLEQLLFSAATRDGTLARRLLAYLGRSISITQLASPATLMRALRVNLTHFWQTRNAWAFS